MFKQVLRSLALHIRAVFAWRLVRRSGVWEYYENALTGQRAAYKVAGSYQPLDGDFMRIGDRVIEPGGNRIYQLPPPPRGTPPPQNK